MSACNEYLELIGQKLDGCLSEADAQRLDAHLRQCPRCRSVLEAYSWIDHGVKQLEEDPPADLHSRIMEAVAAEPMGDTQTGDNDGIRVVPVKKRRFFFGPGTAMAAAAAVLVLLVGTGTVRLPGLSTDSSSTAASQATVAEDTAESAEEDAGTVSYALDDTSLSASTTGAAVKEAEEEIAEATEGAGTVSEEETIEMEIENSIEEGSGSALLYSGRSKADVEESTAAATTESLTDDAILVGVLGSDYDVTLSWNGEYDINVAYNIAMGFLDYEMDYQKDRISNTRWAVSEMMWENVSVEYVSEDFFTFTVNLFYLPESLEAWQEEPPADGLTYVVRDENGEREATEADTEAVYAKLSASYGMERNADGDWQLYDAVLDGSHVVTPPDGLLDEISVGTVVTVKDAIDGDEMDQYLNVVLESGGFYKNNGTTGDAVCYVQQEAVEQMLDTLQLNYNLVLETSGENGDWIMIELQRA